MIELLADMICELVPTMKRSFNGLAYYNSSVTGIELKNMSSANACDPHFVDFREDYCEVINDYGEIMAIFPYCDPTFPGNLVVCLTFTKLYL